ncbi:MAG: hypothetical protein SVY53_00505 [Chloroflexota bacterium]|nr:hypothetical protein [Chloroflexota bacterium]
MEQAFEIPDQFSAPTVFGILPERHRLPSFTGQSPDEHVEICKQLASIYKVGPSIGVWSRHGL